MAMIQRIGSITINDRDPRHWPEDEMSRYVSRAKISAIAISFIPLIWAKFLITRLIATQYDCGVLMNLPYNQVCAVMVLILLLLIFHFLLSLASIKTRVTTYAAVRSLVATLVALAVVVISLCLVTIPRLLDKKHVCGIFGSSPSPPPMLMNLQNNKNNSAYWNENIRSCFCAMPACEDSVYKYYMSHQVYHGVVYSKMSRYTGVGEVVKEESTPDPHYHDVCYLATMWNTERRRLCYDCHGCEEEYLASLQKRCWELGNTIYVMGWLLIFSNLILLVDDLWAHYERR